MISTNNTWKELLRQLIDEPEYESSPRGTKVKEVLGAQYKVQAPAFVSLEERNLNYAFMFAEAAWIISGSNRLSGITPYMKKYENYSDEGVFLNGAYGPKIVDQLPYIVSCLKKDPDSRQAVINIWREKPSSSKDIPCTTTLQFLIRDNKLNMIVNMRSQDIVLGLVYDVFSFSMVLCASLILLRNENASVRSGSVYLNIGSLHLYETDEFKATSWLKSNKINEEVIKDVESLQLNSYDELIDQLRELSNKYLKKEN